MTTALLSSRAARDWAFRGPLLVIVLVLFLLPPLWLLASALKAPNDIFAWPPTLLPSPATLVNFATAFDQTGFGLFFQNSLFVATISAAISVLISLMAGYALAKFRFRGETFFFMLIMSALMIPLQIILIPIFIVLKDLGLLNSLWGVILAPAATPSGVFIMRQYIRSIPDSLLEAARIDGTPEWRILFRIILPLSVPAIAALAAFNFVWRWNDYLWPYLIITDQSKWTVQLALANNVGQWDINWPRLLAMSVLSVIPTLVLFVSLQRYFMNGLLSGASKE
ncbi:carbohydrate ABC transporter permease [Rhizobium skierniewicense]|uniref:carbohydrate ABC transporter permease n=1 Tax=Rhizobium skierniewicense TaxID=984260 RepID=UPI0015726695|nr:carbohydrate ABC transporter permease [Rhizobium skierniewicense]NTF30472.1 carbohydrate ABC transporter permease [Rhizobium skierniewicense]